MKNRIALLAYLLAVGCGGSEFSSSFDDGTGAHAGDDAGDHPETGGLGSTGGAHTGTGGSVVDPIGSGGDPGSGGATTHTGGTTGSGGSSPDPADGGGTGGNVPASGGAAGSGGTPETGGTSSGGAGGGASTGGSGGSKPFTCTFFVCSESCPMAGGHCCIPGYPAGINACGCTYATGDPTAPFGCH